MQKIRIRDTALYDSIFYLSSSSFDFDTYPTFYSDADLDPASQNDADPDLQHTVRVLDRFEQLQAAFYIILLFLGAEGRHFHKTKSREEKNDA
jgi:hypothetical protein